MESPLLLPKENSLPLISLRQPKLKNHQIKKNSLSPKISAAFLQMEKHHMKSTPPPAAGLLPKISPNQLWKAPPARDAPLTATYLPCISSSRCQPLISPSIPLFLIPYWLIREWHVAMQDGDTCQASAARMTPKMRVYNIYLNLRM